MALHLLESGSQMLVAQFLLDVGVSLRTLQAEEAFGHQLLPLHTPIGVVSWHACWETWWGDQPLVTW